ncbi:hypothetical protein Tco_0322345 [Tanacetum coccineum]
MESVFCICNYAENCQVKYDISTLLDIALTWWNFHLKTMGINVAYAMTWKELIKMMFVVYCPRNEIQNMKNELWNLTVKGNDVVGYTQSGTTRLQDTIQLPNSLMEQKVHVIATKDADNKRKWEDECGGKGHTKRYCPGSENHNGDEGTRQNLDIVMAAGSDCWCVTTSHKKQQVQDVYLLRGDLSYCVCFGLVIAIEETADMGFNITAGLIGIYVNTARCERFGRKENTNSDSFVTDQ